MIVTQIPLNAICFFIALDKENNQIYAARSQKLKTSYFIKRNTVMESYRLYAPIIDQDFHAFNLYHLCEYEKRILPNLTMLRYDFEDHKDLPHIHKSHLLSYVKEKLFPYIEENDIRPTSFTTLLDVKKSWQISALNTSQIANSTDFQIEYALRKHRKNYEFVEQLLKLILTAPENFIFANNSILYDKILKTITKTEYYDENFCLTEPFNIIPNEVVPLQFFIHKYSNEEFEELLKLYRFQIEEETSQKIKWIDLMNDSLIEKQIDWSGWNWDKINPDILVSIFKLSSYYKKNLKHNYISDFLSPYYLLIAAQKIRQADRYSEIACSETRPLEKKLLINEATYLRETGWLDCVAIKTELLKSYPFNKMDFPSKFGDLKKDIAECTLLGIPFLDELKRNFSELKSRLQSTEIIPALKTELNSDNHQIRIDNEHTSKCHLININKKYHLNNDTVLVPPKFLSNLLGEKEMSYMSLSAILDGYQDLFEYRKPSFRTSIQLNTTVPEDNLNSFIKDYMAEMGYQNVPYFAFKFRDKNQTLIEIVGENFVEIDGQCHAVCSVLNHYKAPLVFNELLKKYQLTPLSKINKYLSGQDPEILSAKNNPKLKI